MGMRERGDGKAENKKREKEKGSRECYNIIIMAEAYNRFELGYESRSVPEKW